jgi:sodium transport system permease protein
VIFKKEALDILRDRRAIFFAFLLPLILYPVLFFSFAAISRQSERRLTLHLGFSGDPGGFLRYLDDMGIIAAEKELQPEAIRDGTLALFLRFEDETREGLDKKNITIYHAVTSAKSEEGRRRVHKAISRYREDLLKEILEKEGISVSDVPLQSAPAVDVSREDERSASRLGRLLPLLLVVLLLTGGSFAAIDLVAGEKERGTLETLFLHPVPSQSIVWGKLLVLFITSLASLLFNFAGMLISFVFGLSLNLAGELAEGFPLFLPPAHTLLLLFALTLPLCAFTSALLLVLSSYARSFREAQTYLLPLTLISLLLVLLALSPGAKLASVVSIIPVANVALAIREALEGSLELFPFCVAFGSSTLHAGVALYYASRVLGREEVVLNLGGPSLLRETTVDGRARRAFFFAFLMLIFFYFAATWAQSRSPYGGLLFTLWVLVLVPALLYPVFLKLPFREALGLRPAPPRDFLLAILAALSAPPLVLAYQSFQNEILPLPPEVEEQFRRLMEGISPLSGLFLFAISPGICEELLWRGAFQGELEPRKTPLRTIVTVGLFFGFFHLDSYRLVPTALAGMLLAFVRHRTGSIFPCMLIHTLYNALLYLSSVFEPSLKAHGIEELLGRPWVPLGCACVLGGALWGMGPRPPAPAARH